MLRAGEVHNKAVASAAASAEDEAAAVAAASVLEDATEGPEFSFLRSISSVLLYCRLHDQNIRFSVT
jgi:hypothetical protein